MNILKSSYLLIFYILKIFSNSLKFLFETYNKVLYLYLILQREEKILNMNHTAKLTEYFLKKEQETALYFLISKNILFNFMQYLDFPIIRNLFLFLMGNLYHNSYLSIKNQAKLYKYLSQSSFFIDLAKVMLIPSIKQMNLEKTKENFHAFDMDSFKIQKEIRVETSTNINKINENVTLFEEYTGFRTDIDRVKEFIHGKKNFLFKKIVKQMEISNKIKSFVHENKK